MNLHMPGSLWLLTNTSQIGKCILRPAALLSGMCHSCYSVGRVSEHPHNASESPLHHPTLFQAHHGTFACRLADLQCSLAQTLTLEVGAALTQQELGWRAPHMESGIMTAACHAGGNEIRFGCNFGCSPTVAATVRKMRYRSKYPVRSVSYRRPTGGKESTCVRRTPPFRQAAGAQTVANEMMR
jgi:hypothetical protein